MGISMATVNFSVPDEVKAAFDRTFKSQNKSAVIAELMRRPVSEAKLKQRRRELRPRTRCSTLPDGRRPTEG